MYPDKKPRPRRISIRGILAFVLLLLLFCSLLCGCASREAKAVMRDIRAIGEVTLDSKDTLEEVNRAYLLLSKEDREDVRNYDVLVSAQEEYDRLCVQDLDDRIARACGEDPLSYDTLLSLRAECSHSRGTADLTNYDLLLEKLDEIRLQELDDRIAQACEEDPLSYDTLLDLEAECSSEDLEKLEHYDLLLEKLDEAYVRDLDDRIALECAAENLSYQNLRALMDECELDPGLARKLSNYYFLSYKLDEAAESYAQSEYGVIQTKMKFKGTCESGMNRLQEDQDLLSEEQIEVCLALYGQWDAVSQAENLLKTYLKSPSSYRCYSSSVSGPYLQDDGSYLAVATLHYGATNSFGAEVTNDASVYVYYTVNPYTLSVRYTETKLSPATAFQIYF